MTEIEQLRKEVNELRERVAFLEKRPTQMGMHLDWNQRKPFWVIQPSTGPSQLPLNPPFTITC